MASVLPSFRMTIGRPSQLKIAFIISSASAHSRDPGARSRPSSESQIFDSGLLQNPLHGISYSHENLGRPKGRAMYTNRDSSQNPTLIPRTANSQYRWSPNALSHSLQSKGVVTSLTPGGRLAHVVRPMPKNPLCSCMLLPLIVVAAGRLPLNSLP
jgi:hypothetical protein